MATGLPATHWEARSLAVTRELEWHGWHLIGDRLLADGSGSCRWIIQPPAQRSWTANGALERSDPVAWTLEPMDGGVRLVVSASAELDTVDLGRSAAQAFEHGHHPPLTVVGSFATLGPPAHLARFLVGGAVLDTHEFLGQRCPSEQTALSIYRLARLRGGAFWDGVAAHVAAVVADRIERAPGGMPVHDLMGQGETHVRFLVDAILLLQAEAERNGGGHPAALAERALDALEGFAIPWEGGTWYLHDSVERDAGANELVLNTHVHSLIARLAGGRPIDEGLLALDRCLSLTGERARGTMLAAALAASDRLRASGPGSLAEVGNQLHWMAQASAGRSRARSAHLRLPGGWLARDAGPSPNPPYHLVNLNDLAVLQRNRPTARVGKVLRSAARYARFSGFFAAETACGDEAAVLVPTALTNMGCVRAARRAASGLRRSGIDPAIGWPGFADQLWPRLAPATP
ncbi:MAG TPA: hypothetical protein VGL48_14985 [Acidimicrobiales bacterium]